MNANKFEAFLNELADFSNIKENLGDKSSIDTKLNYRISESIQEQLDFNNNTKLMTQFKTMRQKIKQLTKQANEYKIAANNSQKQIEAKFINQIVQLQEKDVQNMAAMGFLKKQLEQINNLIDQLKIKNQELLKQLNAKKNIQKQLQYLQTASLQSKHENQQLRREIQKIHEISIMQKIQLEERIKNFNLVKEVDNQYVHQLEIELNKVKEKFINIEGKHRRLQNQYEESKFDRERLTQQYKKEQDLNQIIAELKKEKEILKAQLTDEKQKRLRFESKMMEIEEFSSLYTIQIETLKREISHLKKKNKKLVSKFEEKDAKADKQTYKNIQTKTKLFKIIQISQEFLARVKREMNMSISHDFQQYFKAVEYKINRLKQEQQRRQDYSLSKSKSKSKSKKKERGNQNLAKSNINNKSQSHLKKNQNIQGIDRVEETYTEPQQKNHDSSNYITPKYVDEIKQTNPTYKQTSFSNDYYDENICILPPPLKKQDLFTKSQKILSDQVIEKKVKKERIDKQRKMRQNILYKKLESSNNDKQKFLLREELLKLTQTEN